MRLAGRYDGITIAFHWLTAALVAALFVMPLWWKYAPHAVRFRFELEDLHVSLGLALAAVIAGRLLWRVLRQHALPPAGYGVAQWLARAVHVLLYVMLAAQIGLGLVLSGMQGGELSFFGLFSLPSLTERNRGLSDLVEQMHNWNAWALIVVAGGHAAMALVHHHLLHDDVLRRMLPALR